MLFVSQTDIDAAIAGARTSLAPSTSLALQVQTQMSTPVIQNSNSESTEAFETRKVAHNLATRFKFTDKFFGKLGEEISKSINRYMDAANDYDIIGDHKLKYFHNIFDGEARQFYHAKVDGIADTFGFVGHLMRPEFNSITRQKRVRQCLQNLPLAPFMAKQKCSFTEGLESSILSSRNSLCKAHATTKLRPTKSNISTEILSDTDGPQMPFPKQWLVSQLIFSKVY